MTKVSHSENRFHLKLKSILSSLRRRSKELGEVTSSRAIIPTTLCAEMSFYSRDCSRWDGDAIHPSPRERERDCSIPVSQQRVQFGEKGRKTSSRRSARRKILVKKRSWKIVCLKIPQNGISWLKIKKIDNPAHLQHNVQLLLIVAHTNIQLQPFLLQAMHVASNSPTDPASSLFLCHSNAAFR